jgi:hypothetical protein
VSVHEDITAVRSSDLTAWLGLEAPAWAWLGRALASLSSNPSPSRRVGLGLAWLWLKPRLASNFLLRFHLRSIMWDTRAPAYVHNTRKGNGTERGRILIPNLNELAGNWLEDFVPGLINRWDMYGKTNKLLLTGCQRFRQVGWYNMRMSVVFTVFGRFRSPGVCRGARASGHWICAPVSFHCGQC